MAKREFLMLGKDFEFGKYAIGDWYVSEKIDGIRCMWDGGISRGLRCAEVPFANTAKHFRFVNEPIATGLWTRYGQPIHAPDWWLNKLPKLPLDGELTMGRGTWQETSSTVKQHHPDDRWQKVRYAVFDSPPFEWIFGPGTINNANFKKTFPSNLRTWAEDRAEELGICRYGSMPFFSIYHDLRNYLIESEGYYVLPQESLPLSYTAADAKIREKLAEIEEAGGEGLMIRDPGKEWRPERVNYLLKAKASRDAEGIVIGYRIAKPTDLDRSLTGVQTDKLVGLMGSLRIQMDNGTIFDLPGFKESERQFGLADGRFYDSVQGFTRSHPGELAPDWIQNPLFPRGSRVSFKYRELSDTGVPKEPRYWRKDDQS